MTVKYIISTLILLLFIFIFSGCATKGAPSGGPADRTAPVVVFTMPKSDSLFINTNLDYIQIQFSERMEESSLTRNIFVSPPFDYELDWEDAETIRLLLKDTLKQNHTYVITVGAGAADEHRNKMDGSYLFAFSTGDKIDRGRISGSVYDVRKDEVASIFAYEINDSTELNPARQIPDYISQSGKKGAYTLDYLKNGTYRIFAVIDQNNNRLMDGGPERFGITYTDIRLDSARQDFNSIDFRLSQSDTTAPQIVSVRPLKSTYLQMRFSEPIIVPDSSFLTVVDSISSDTLKILGRSVNFEYDNILDVFTEKMKIPAVYYVYSSAIRDSAGNITALPDTLFFNGIEDDDTLTFQVIDFLPEDSAASVHPTEEIIMEFSNAINWNTVKENFLLSNMRGYSVNVNWKINSQYDAVFRPAKGLLPDSSYTIMLNPDGVKNLWNKELADSLLSHYFSVVSMRELGELTGKILWADDNESQAFLKLRKLGARSGPVEIIVSEPGPFRFDHLREGKYMLSGFVDLDNNGRYSHGTLSPFKHSEPFYYSNDTLKVRKRWETPGIIFRLPGKKIY